MSGYQLFRARYVVIETASDGSTKNVRFDRNDWFDPDVVDHPESGVSYGPPTKTETSQESVGIRMVR